MRSPTEIKTANTTRRIDELDLVVIDGKIQEYNSHISITKSGAHQITNIEGLVSALSAKVEASALADAMSTKVDKNSVSGNLTVVTGVNFEAKTVTTSTIFYHEGQITGVL